MSSFNNMFKKNKDKSKRNSMNFGDFKQKFLDSNSSDTEIIKRPNEIYSDMDSQYDHKSFESTFDKDIYQTKDNFEKIKQKFDNPKNKQKSTNIQKKNTFICGLCNESHTQFIILDCGHTFHINCLAKQQLSDAMNCPIIDNENFFDKIKCHSCNTPLESCEITMIHNKFYKGTSVYITNHNKTMDKLDLQLNNLKNEMKVCMEYKQKLEFDQQKSKQILTLLNTLPL